MAGDSFPQRLANDVAEAADAWLRDPRDAGIYTRLVQAVDRWRTATRPTLDIEPARAADDESTDETWAEDGEVELPPGHTVPMPIAQTIDEFRRTLPGAAG